MNIKGKYKVYKNGLLVAEQENLVTTFGISYILGFLANQNPSAGSAIAVGTSTTAATLSDLTLGFEFTRGQIGVRSVLSGVSQIVLKASLDDLVGGVINELGLFPTISNASSGIYGTKILAQFDPTLESWSGGATNIVNFKIGTASLEYDLTTSQTLTYTFNPFSEDLSGYSTIDQFSLGYFTNDTHAANITIQFQTDSADYFQYSFTPSNTAGYFIQNWNKVSMTTVGTPDWSNITTLSASVTASGAGSSVVELDGLIVTDKDIYQDYGLISHAILGSPVTKAPDETLDVEYILGITVNG